MMNPTTMSTRPTSARPARVVKSRTRRARGFSLLELVLVSAVSSIIMLMVVRWVLTLGTVSAMAIDNATAGRNAAYVNARMSSDFDSVTQCDPGSASTLYELSSTTVAFFITTNRPDGSSGVELVRWTIDGTLVTRTATPIDQASNHCSDLGSSATAAVIVNNVLTGAAITGFDSEGNDSGTCTLDGQSSTPTGTGCSAASVRIHLPLYSPGVEKSPAVMDRIYSLPGARA